ncbi:MAG TPA: hypothetical protein VGO62_21420, partial [Myxococcota bacterium]
MGSRHSLVVVVSLACALSFASAARADDPSDLPPPPPPLVGAPPAPHGPVNAGDLPPLPPETTTPKPRLHGSASTFDPMSPGAVAGLQAVAFCGSLVAMAPIAIVV